MLARARPLKRLSMASGQTQLKVFGSRVCVRRSGKRREKLDKHSFERTVIGCTDTTKKVHYLNLHIGLVKTGRHAPFDEAWYYPWSQPLSAQLLYDLGVDVGDKTDNETAIYAEHVPSPPCPSTHNGTGVVSLAENLEMLPLALGLERRVMEMLPRGRQLQQHAPQATMCCQCTSRQIPTTACLKRTWTYDTITRTPSKLVE